MDDERMNIESMAREALKLGRESKRGRALAARVRRIAKNPWMEKNITLDPAKEAKRQLKDLRYIMNEYLKSVSQASKDITADEYPATKVQQLLKEFRGISNKQKLIMEDLQDISKITFDRWNQIQKERYSR